MADYNPDDYPFAGEVLLDKLDELGISQETLAAHIGVPTDDIVKLCSGRAKMTATLACKLSRAFGGRPKEWMDVQNNWDLVHVPKREYEEIQPLAQSKK